MRVHINKCKKKVFFLFYLLEYDAIQKNKKENIAMRPDSPHPNTHAQTRFVKIHTITRVCTQLERQCHYINTLCKSWMSLLPQQLPNYYLLERTPLAAIIHTAYQFRQVYMPRLEAVQSELNECKTSKFKRPSIQLIRRIQKLQNNIHSSIKHLTLYLAEINQSTATQTNTRTKKETALVRFYNKKITLPPTPPHISKLERRTSQPLFTTHEAGRLLNKKNSTPRITIYLN